MLVSAVVVSCLWAGLLAQEPESRIAADSAVDGMRPNVVLILADDMGIGDPGCYNPASAIPTPHLDRLAHEGMRFLDTHSPSAVCTPTRYALLTGRYCWRSRLKSGVLGGRSPNLIEPGRATLASLLRGYGYRTACVGKWHLGLGTAERTDYEQRLQPGPLDFGFDEFFGIPASLDMEPYVYVRGDRVVALPTEEIAGSKQRRQGGGGFWRGGQCAPGFRHEQVLPTLTREAVAFLEAQAAGQSPFFLYFPLTAPHTPWMPLPEFAGRSEAGHYGDFAAQVDASVGEVLNALDRLRLTRNTLIVFTSDNGAHWTPNDKEQYDHLANLRLRGQKADIWEGGHRVPMLVRWPEKVAPGTHSDQLICLTDWMATLTALLGGILPRDAGEDSFDFSSVLLGAAMSGTGRNSIVHHSLNGTFAYRRGAWKLVLGRGSGGFSAPRKYTPEPGEAAGELYHLQSDPFETRNLYLEYPERVRALSAELDDLRARGRSRE